MTINFLSKKIEKITYPVDEKRPYIGASGIGAECLRQIWYGYKGYDGEPNAPRLQRAMDIGKNLESMVIDLIEAANIKVIRPHKDNNFLEYCDPELQYLRGHLDAILPDLKAVVDIKVVKASSWRTFVNQGLRAWSPTYYAQLQAYMGMTLLENAYLLALNKDTAELHDEKIEFNPHFYDSLKKLAQMIAISSQAPPKASNNPSWWLCKMCKYKKVCHE